MRDPKTEHFLNAGNYKWKYVEKIPFKEIDIKASLENPARLHQTVNEEAALGYALAMEAGDEFPALVLLTQDPAASVLPYLIATGVHRFWAARDHKIRDWFDAYVVTEADGYRRKSLIRRLNILESAIGVTMKDRIAQALQDHKENPEISLQVLAGEWHLKIETLKAAQAMEEALERGRKFGYALDNGKVKLTQKSIMALGQIHLNKPFERACNYALLSGATTNDIVDLCKEIKKTRDEPAAMAAVDRATMTQAEKQLAAHARGGRVPIQPASAFFGDIRRLHNQADKGLERLHLASYSDRNVARSLCEQTITLMKRVLAALDHIDRIERPGSEPRPPIVH